MKKLLFIMALIVVATMVRGQNATYTMPSTSTYLSTGTDYTLTNTTEKWFKFIAAKDYLTTQDFQCLFHKTTTSITRVDVTFSGRKFSGDGWTSLGTGYWIPESTDSLVTISTTVPTGYREFKVNYAGTGTGNVYITNQALKLWKF